MENEVVSEVMKDYIHKLAVEGKRLDGRAMDTIRDIVVKKNVIETAEGSAQVNLGDTTVLVGVKAAVGPPYPDTPDKGVLTSLVELIPMASPSFESGPPRPNAVELARVVDRGIRESRMIDLSRLCIEQGEKVWVLFLDMHVLDYDGNLFDACSIASVAALGSTVIPHSTIDPEKEDEPLEIERWPVSLTSVKIKGDIFIDPSLEEENVAEARLTVTLDEEGRIRAMQKGIGGSLDIDDVERTIDLCMKYREGIVARIKGA